MSFSQGSRSGLSYVAETTYGTTPATPGLTQLPINTHTLSLTKDRVQGNEIQPDRMPRVDRHGNRQVGGDIVVDLRKGDFDPLLESAFFNSFSSDVLTVGTKLKSFSIEDAAQDISQYRLFTGCAVSSAAFSLKPNQMVTTTFTVVGSDMTLSGTSVDGTKTASSGNSPFDAYSGALKIANSGASLSEVATITGIDFTLNNSLAPTFVIGSSATPQLEYGMAAVEGTITAYFEDASLVNRFINETETALEVSVNDPTGTNPYTFLFPRVKFNTGDVPMDGPTSRVINISFVSLYDTTEGTNLKLTRTSA